MLELRGAARAFGGRIALAPTDLTAPAGKVTVLLGPSGCGKSTILKLFLGLLRPDRGEARVDGERVDERTAPALRRRIGYVVQEGGLFPHLTAAGNATLLARTLGWPRDRIRARLAELARLTRLEPAALDRYPPQLSGGQRQRVGLIRALFLDPPYLLLDEPLGALDPVTRFELQRDLRELFRELHRTVLLVTHDLGEAAFLGDAVALMRSGRILQHGPLRELAERPADPFVERFIQAWRAPLAELAGGPP